MRFLVTAAVAMNLGMGFAAAAAAAPMQAVLRLSERVPLEQLAKNVTDPSSPRYQQFYTPEEIRALAGPTDADYQDLVAKLAARGFKVVHESPTHLFLTIEAETPSFEHAFQVRITALNERERAASGALLVPGDLKLVASVSGLDTRRHAHPLFQVVRRHSGDDNPGITPAQIKTLYGFDALYQQGLTGAGQHIAVATYGDVNLDDVTSYYQKNDIKPAPTVDTVAFNGKPQQDHDSAIESEMDAEFSGALAPGASIHVFTSATNDDPGETALFTAVLDDNRAKVVNYSWGDCENDIKPDHKSDMDKVFARAIAQGVNIMVASGDSGSACQDAQGKTTDPMPDWPAAHPDVVAVGGTSIDTSANGLSESGWSSSGGGVSTFYDLPDWQKSFQDPYVKRSYPDVAFNADPKSGQAAWVHGLVGASYLVVGGTSMASPQWCGFLALVGEARAKADLPGLGFLNPIIYAQAGADQSSLFDVITSGDNGKYKAQQGWNAVTGWGGMRADLLLPLLTKG